MPRLIKALAKVFSSIGVKLFLSFWLMALCAVMATHLISSQFTQEGVLRPANQNDVQKLRKLSKNINRRPVKSVEMLIKRSRQLRNDQLIFKDINSSEIFTFSKNNIEDIEPFLTKNNFSNLTSIHFVFARVTGPLTIKIADTDYQIYLASQMKQRQFRRLVMGMPLWLRVSIPILISIILSWLLAKSLVRPIIAMKHTSAKFGNGDLSARVNHAVLRNDEIGELAKSFNGMAEKIETNFGAHQRLLADVSHELRSPMTRLQIALALAEKCKTEPEKLTRHINRCELEVSRLDQMISDVLCLSSLENSPQALVFKAIDLNQFIQSIVEDEQYIANEKSIMITVQYLPCCMLPLDKQLIHSAIGNILSNAIKYSAEQSEIKVNMTVNATHLKLTIVDQGIGVPNADLEHLFKPFYRVSQSRERATGGTGLGLAIARQAIIAHKGTIAAQNNVDKGLMVTIELPLKQP
jgi:two-component system sensor histidine kinase CpxA